MAQAVCRPAQVAGAGSRSTAPTAAHTSAIPSPHNLPMQAGDVTADAMERGSCAAVAGAAAGAAHMDAPPPPPYPTPPSAAAAAAAIAVSGLKRGRAQYEGEASGDVDEDEWQLDYGGDETAEYDPDADAEVTALLEAAGLIDTAFMAAHAPKRRRCDEAAATREVANADAAAAITATTVSADDGGGAAEAAMPAAAEPHGPVAAYAAAAADPDACLDILADALHEPNRIALRNVVQLCDTATVCGLLQDTLAMEVRCHTPPMPM